MEDLEGQGNQQKSMPTTMAGRPGDGANIPARAPGIETVSDHSAPSFDPRLLFG
jgi:hypothetical protein